MAKKAISYCMPNKLTKWNPMAQNGNPTQSVEVNGLIKKIKIKKFVSRASRVRPGNLLSLVSWSKPWTC
jgi:hypothetical protein